MMHMSHMDLGFLLPLRLLPMLITIIPLILLLFVYSSIKRLEQKVDWLLAEQNQQPAQQPIHQPHQQTGQTPPQQPPQAPPQPNVNS
ncbi:MAG: hypothetical protein GC154_11985 [bacterium]|nr:hypothetical protein [bacterium]